MALLSAICIAISLVLPVPVVVSSTVLSSCAKKLLEIKMNSVIIFNIFFTIFTLYKFYFSPITIIF